MTQFVPFTEEPMTTQDQILEATYNALHQYGYAGLSIQRIADFTEISKSSIYYHFENKNELLLAFLEAVLQNVRHRFDFESRADPVADLNNFINQIFNSIDPETEEETVPIGAYIEIRSQAVWNDAYRERITDIDTALKEQFRSILSRGVDQGVMKDIDMNQVGEFLVTMLTGTLERYVTSTGVSLDQIQIEVNQYLTQCVVL